jgi:Flp pilus assembly pilin Flp
MQHLFLRSRLFLRRLFSSAPSGKPNRKEGQTLVEYALILAILTIVLLAAFSTLGQQVIRIFSAITTLLDTAQAS